MNSLGPLEEAPAYMIYRLSRLLRQNLKQVLHAGGLDVTTEQYFLLYRLFQKDAVVQSALADSMLGDYPNITRHIDSLEKKGLVVRTHDAHDRRRYLILLTDKGRAHMEQAVQLIEQERSRLFASFDKQQISAFKEFVHTVQDRLR